ncbi:MAG TPA: ABC transporter permease, partial [Atribacterota bacterium]|nr:ABC transporter permease [Atribacterota bacterium]
MSIFAVLAATILGLPDPLVTAREAGIFRNYKINGVPALSILVIPALTTIIHSSVVTMIIVTTAPLFFNAPLPVNWLYFIVTFMVTAFACAGLSVLIGVISSSSRMTVLWSQLVFIPSMILGGMMVPFSMLPGSISKIALLLPATHAMNAFRGLAQNLTADFNPIGSLIILLTSGVLAFGLAIYLFNWDRRNAAQPGHPLMALLILLPYVIGIFILS